MNDNQRELAARLVILIALMASEHYWAHLENLGQIVTTVIGIGIAMTIAGLVKARNDRPQ